MPKTTLYRKLKAHEPNTTSTEAYWSPFYPEQYAPSADEDVRFEPLTEEEVRQILTTDTLILPSDNEDL